MIGCDARHLVVSSAVAPIWHNELLSSAAAHLFRRENLVSKEKKNIANLFIITDDSRERRRCASAAAAVHSVMFTQ